MYCRGCKIIFFGGRFLLFVTWKHLFQWVGRLSLVCTETKISASAEFLGLAPSGSMHHLTQQQQKCQDIGLEQDLGELFLYLLH